MEQIAFCKGEHAQVQSVLLLTDGLANEGIQGREGILGEMRRMQDPPVQGGVAQKVMMPLWSLHVWIYIQITQWICEWGFRGIVVYIQHVQDYVLYALEWFTCTLHNSLLCMQCMTISAESMHECLWECTRWKTQGMKLFRLYAHDSGFLICRSLMAQSTRLVLVLIMTPTSWRLSLHKEVEYTTTLTTVKRYIAW